MSGPGHVRWPGPLSVRITHVATTFDQVTEVVPARDGHDAEVLDGIDALRVLRADTAEEKTKLLEQIAGTGKVEQDIVSELSKVRPLWKPNEFEAAHRMAMRSLEVLDRNGARQPRLPRLGPLKPIASWLVQLVTRWIVRNHQNGLVTSIRKLYEKREANAAWDTPEHHALRRARIDVTRLEEGLKANPIGLPKILLGGAFLSGVISGMSRLMLSLLDRSHSATTRTRCPGVDRGDRAPAPPGRCPRSGPPCSAPASPPGSRRAPSRTEDPSRAVDQGACGAGIQDR
jgi:hypothetical protein